MAADGLLDGCRLHVCTRKILVQHARRVSTSANAESNDSGGGDENCRRHGFHASDRVDRNERKRATNSRLSMHTLKLMLQFRTRLAPISDGGQLISRARLTGNRRRRSSASASTIVGGVKERDRRSNRRHRQDRGAASARALDCAQINRANRRRRPSGSFGRRASQSATTRSRGSTPDASSKLGTRAFK